MTEAKRAASALSEALAEPWSTADGLVKVDIMWLDHFDFAVVADHQAESHRLVMAAGQLDVDAD